MFIQSQAIMSGLTYRYLPGPLMTLLYTREKSVTPVTNSKRKQTPYITYLDQRDPEDTRYAGNKPDTS